MHSKHIVSAEQASSQECPICLVGWHAAGPHRLSCLQCGHLFGKNCIERWLAKHNKCPTCQAPAKPKDVRVLFAPAVQVQADQEAARLGLQLQSAKRRCFQLERRNTLLQERVKALEDKLGLLQGTRNQKLRLKASVALQVSGLYGYWLIL